jgi:catechol 2,3-dioxygenase-like lactoylglutathione lyase family enzyme
MFGRKQPEHHIPARVRAYGRARIEIAQRAQSRQDWDALWKPPQQPFLFDWGEPWKQCIEYSVDDFAAEVGFLIDVLGLPVNAFNADYAMFTSPNQDFYFAVVQTQNGARSTPPDALRLQFMVTDIFATTQELERRGVHLAQEARPIFEGSRQWVASFHTPHGIALEIWGLVEMVPEQPAAAPPIETVHPEEFSQRLIEKESQPLLEEEESRLDELEEAESEESALEETEVARFHWQVDEDDETEPDEIDAETVQTEPIHSRNLSPYTSPEQPQSSRSLSSSSTPSTPVPAVRTFQNGQAMLDHLKQKKSQQQFSQKAHTPRQQSSPPQAAPPPANNLSFRPAPKKADEEADDSIWSQIDQDSEYINPDEASSDEYHYTPIPLNRKP